MTWPLNRKKTLILGIALILGVLALVAIFGGKPKSETVTENVHRGRLQQTVEVTGEVEAITELELAFEQGGTVSTVAVRVGQAVVAGEMLAGLRAADLAADVTRAQAVLDRELAGAGYQDIVIAEADLALAKNSVSSAEADITFALASEDLIASLGAAQAAEASSAQTAAQINLDQTLATNTLNITEAKVDLLDELEASVIDVRSALSDADQVLGIENSLSNYAFEDELGARDPQTLINATRAFEAAAIARDQAEELVYALTETSSDETLDRALLVTYEALDATSLTLLYTRQVLDATSGDSTELSLTELEVFKDDIDAARATVQTQTVLLTGADQTYTDAIATARDLEADARQAVTSAGLAVATANANEQKNNSAATEQVAKSQAALAARQAELIRAEAQLAKVSDAPRAVDLRPLEADVMAAEARLAKTQIVSPIDGIVTSIDVKRGEQASPGLAVIGVQATGEEYVVPVNIPESDIAKVSVGDPAEITLDAFGDDLKFTAKVVSINPSETTIEGVIYYEAKVVFTDDQDLSNLRSGMSADVTIVTEVREETLFLPQRAVLERDGIRYVRIPAGESYTERTVSVGIRGDDGLIEILSGVSEDETVIVSLNQ